MRRIAKWILWMLLALVVFHRPLLHFAGRRIAIWFAAKEHMALDFHLAGNLWNHLEIRDVSIRADGKGPAPIDRLKLDRLALDYDLWKAIHSDWTHVLHRVDVGDLDGVITLQPAKNDGEPDQPFAEVFRKLLSNSLLPVEQVTIGRASLEVKDIAAITGFHVEFQQRKPGQIAWEKIHVAGLPDFGKASGEFTTDDSSISIAKLPLFPQLVVRRLSLNRITPTMPRGGFEFLAEAGGGTAGLRVEPSLTKNALDVSVDVDAVRLNELARPFGIDLPAPATIESFHAKLSGAPEKIEDSTADAGFVFRLEEKDSIPPAVIRGAAKFGRGVFRISELSLVSPGAELNIGGELNVPLPNYDPAKLSGEITWKLTAPDLAALHLQGLPEVHGAVSGAGKLHLENGEAHTTGQLETAKLSQVDVAVDSAVFHLDARRKIAALGDIITGLLANLSFEAKGVAAHGIRVDAISVNGKLDGQNVSISEFTATSGENRITGSARALLKPGAAGIEGSPEMDVKIAAPRLEQFGVVVNGTALNGAVTAEGKLQLDGTQVAGNLQANGTGLLLGNAPLGGFRAQVKLENGAAILESLIVNVADAGEVTATGRTTLDAPMAYTGELHGAFANLGKLDAIFAAAGHHAKLGGALTLDWSGDGRISEKAHNGKLKLAGKNLRRDALLLNEVRIGGAYTPTQFDTDEFLVIADKAKLGARIHWSDARLNVSDLSLAIGRDEIVKGEASIALNPANPDGMLPLDQPLNAQIACKNADLGQLLASAGISAPVTGKLSFDLAAGGTLAKPDVKLTIAARTLKSAQAASVAPADLDATLIVRDARLTLDAVGRQRDIQPFTVSASLPLDFEKLRTHPELARETPLEAVVKLPATSLGIVPRFVPAIARLDGTVAANVEVHGTFAKPIVSGEVTLATKSMRLASGALPPLSNFTSKLNFHDSAITFRDTRGEIGGGKFNVEGSVNLAAPAQPVFDLRLRSDKVLVLRDEAITVRADADVTLRGPLNSATAAGTVFVTQSRFFKDVDILPLSLPGKPKPQARSVSRPMRVSFPNPPLRDWKFDIAIKSRENDSFLIRGNLAKGAAALDLRLGGTGLNPFLTGHVQIENFTAILPASKLEVQRGYVTFSEDDPFQPQLDIVAQSRIGKNTVTTTITGSSTAPHLELASEPPLPQKDILSLLATGTTSGELGSNASTLATKAALLTVKRWYRKTFKKGAEEPAADGQGSFADRFDLDVGNVDPKTGRPEVNASVRITDDVFFLGEIDMGGQFTGKVKYLLRFR